MAIPICRASVPDDVVAYETPKCGKIYSHATRLFITSLSHHIYQHLWISSGMSHGKTKSICKVRRVRQILWLMVI
jgi:hypothetical protein